MTLQISAADLALLNAGKPVTLQPPQAATTPTPTPAPSPGIVAPTLKVVCAQAGKVNPAWVEDYSYDATNVRMYQDTTLPAGAQTGYGNEYAIKVTTTGPWGGFLPSNPPGGATDFSGCSEFTVAISAPKGNTYAMYAVMGGDIAINSPGFTFTKTKDGYETFTTPKAPITQDATRGDVSAKIYKMCIQSKQAAGGDSFLVDNWGAL